MRIISGTARGRRLFTPTRKGRTPIIRPTSDRVREALFSIIGDKVSGAIVLDLYAGTGALGIEALSRGAAGALFVDRNRQAIDLVRKNLDLCGFTERSTVIMLDLSAGRSLPGPVVKGKSYDLIFADPPYREGLADTALDLVGENGLLAADGILLVEEDSRVELPESRTGLALFDRRVYGDTAVHFYKLAGGQLK